MRYVHLIKNEDTTKSENSSGKSNDWIGEERIFEIIKMLMDEYFTGSMTLHLSDGSIRKVETTRVERFGN